MSFGFSVGDFLAVGKLIVDISSSLAESGGSKSEYQELLNELESLQHALVHLDKLQPRGSASANIDSIKYTALSCRRPLECFLAKIKKYDKSLGVRSKEGKIKSAVHKLGWAFGQKDEIRKLQSYLNVHVGTINILLAEHGLEMMDIASEKADAENANIRERLDDTRTIVRWIKDNFSAQKMAVNLANSMLSRLFDMISGEFRTSLKNLETMAVKVCVSTQQIYGVVLEMKSSHDLGDGRWTFFQAPLMIEDALGRKFPVPSEYDYGLLDNIIKYRFSNGPGCLDVKVGNYELFKTTDSKQVLLSSAQLLPGTSITMAILVNNWVPTDSACPMFQCGSEQSSSVPGGGRICCKCDVWFDRSSKKRKALGVLLDVIDEQDGESRRGKRKLNNNDNKNSEDDAPRKRQRVTRYENSSNLFRNVRWTVEQISPDVSLESSNLELINDQTLSGYGPVDDSTMASHVRKVGLSFMDTVKLKYKEDPEIYERFLTIMIAFRQKYISADVLIIHIFHLFHGCEDLFEGFKYFLPPAMPRAQPIYNPDFLVAAEDDHRKWRQLSDQGRVSQNIPNAD